MTVQVSLAIFAVALHLPAIRTIAWTTKQINGCSFRRCGRCNFFDRCGNNSFQRNMNSENIDGALSIPISQSTKEEHGIPRRTPEEIRMTDDVKAIVQEAIHSVDPVVAIHRSLKVEVDTGSNQPNIVITDRQKNKTISYQLDMYSNIIIIGIGKAASSMVSAVLQIISPVINTTKSKKTNTFVPKLKGIVLTKHGHVTDQQREYFRSYNDDIILYEASHPIPCDVGVFASTEIMNLVSSINNATSNSLVLACISGGGSALFCTPKLPGITLHDIQETNAALLQTGWPISTMNTIRTVLEHGKGGGLALAALQSPSTSTEVVSFLLSDVVGDPIDIIASGPTVLPSDAIMQHVIQEAYELLFFRTPSHVQFPRAVMDYVKQEYEHLSDETSNSKPAGMSEKMQQHCCNILVGNNALAVEAAAVKAKALGYHPVVLGTKLQGEASTVAQILTVIAQNIQEPTTSYNIVNDNNLPVALIAGGETTVTLPTESDLNGIGAPRLGGRNQELALAAAIALHENHLRQIVVASVGTDGNDGPTDAAGAIVDGGTVQRLLDSSGKRKSSSLNDNENSTVLSAKDALQYHNSYPYLDQTDIDSHSPLLKTGPTGTNVADIIIILIHKNSKER